MDEEIITATDASRGFSDLLHRVAYGGESFVVKKGHRLMARIVPVEEETVKKPAAKKAKAEKVYVEEAPAAPVAATPAPKAEPVAPQRTQAAPSAGGNGNAPSPSGLTDEDLDFYNDLIAKMGGTPS